MSPYERIVDHAEEQGHCKHCRWWQAQQQQMETPSENESLGLCMQAELTHFSLQVSGQSGCNRFEHAELLQYSGASL